METAKKVTVYYDGTCPICRAAVGSIDTGAATLSKVDITSDTLPPELDPLVLDYEVHVKTAEGGMVTGIDAVAYLLDHKAGGRVFRFITKIPLLRQLLQVLYFLIARNRHRLTSRWGVFAIVSILIVLVALVLYTA